MAHNKHQAAIAATPPVEGRYKIGGPMWSAPIHDGEWVAELLRRVVSMLAGSGLVLGFVMNADNCLRKC
jgi:hypothetical protein